MRCRGFRVRIAARARKVISGHARVAQRQEARFSANRQCAFESHPGYAHGAVDEWESRPAFNRDILRVRIPSAPYRPTECPSGEGTVCKTGYAGSSLILRSASVFPDQAALRL